MPGLKSVNPSLYKSGETPLSPENSYTDDIGVLSPTKSTDSNVSLKQELRGLYICFRYPIFLWMICIIISHKFELDYIQDYRLVLYTVVEFHICFADLARYRNKILLIVCNFLFYYIRHCLNCGCFVFSRWHYDCRSWTEHRIRRRKRKWNGYRGYVSNLFQSQPFMFVQYHKLVSLHFKGFPYMRW